MSTFGVNKKRNVSNKDLISLCMCNSLSKNTEFTIHIHKENLDKEMLIVVLFVRV